MGTSITICGQPCHQCAEGQEHCGGGGGWLAEGCKVPVHCHGSIPPVPQPEGFGCVHLANKCDCWRETNQSELLGGSFGLLPAELASPGSLTTATKGQSRAAASVR